MSGFLGATQKAFSTSRLIRNFLIFSLPSCFYTFGIYFSIYCKIQKPLFFLELLFNCPYITSSIYIFSPTDMRCPPLLNAEFVFELTFGLCILIHLFVFIVTLQDWYLAALTLWLYNMLDSLIGLLFFIILLFQSCIFFIFLIVLHIYFFNMLTDKPGLPRWHYW